ncbi:hypothetical protein BJX76DRAFT_359654 [Aspergillus varians]
MFDDPKCLCQPRPKKPFQKLELTLRGSKTEGSCRLDKPGAQLDVVFDLIGNALTLRETISDPNVRKASYSIFLLLDTKMMHFVNLKGLSDNSLLLSFRMRRSFCSATGKSKMMYKEKYTGFSPNRPESKLYNDFYLCNWSEQYLELRLPAERIVGWKTVALILKTFKRITAENWCRLVKMVKSMKTPPVAGLDWMAIERALLPRIIEPSPVTTAEEETRTHCLIGKKKTAAKKVYQKQTIFVHR